MTSRPSKQTLVIAAVLTIFGAVFTFLIRGMFIEEPAHDDLLRRARLLSVQNRYAEGEATARRAIDGNPESAAAFLLAGQLAAAQGKYQQALEDFEHVGPAHNTFWPEARRQSADIFHNHLLRFRDAEQAYLDLIRLDSNDTLAIEQYATLLGMCGRRSEAIPYILRLVKAGHDTDLLMLLARESGALNDPAVLEAARLADPKDPNPLIGQAHAARSAQNGELALKKILAAAELEGLPENFHGLLGKQLLDYGNSKQIEAWLNRVSDNSLSSDEWIARGSLAERAYDVEGAIRCYWEAVKIRPESLVAVNQLARQLTRNNQPNLSRPFEQRVAEINELRTQQQIAILSGQPPNFAAVSRMIEALETVGRHWEAFAWAQAAIIIAPRDSDLHDRLSELEQRVRDLPLTMTTADYNLGLKIDLSHYRLPAAHRSSDQNSTRSASNNISFTKQGGEIGFTFQFFNGASSPTRRMFELTGGGIGAVDFDNDGCPDIYCSQGTPWNTVGPTESDTHEDCLFRNLRGHSFSEVSSIAFPARESAHGQGVSAGDVNNDGFQDIYVANIGPNRLWVNNGDGTFSDAEQSPLASREEWTTSCLIADINADSIPDIYDVNYLQGDDLFTRLCDEDNGDKIMCSPFDFEGCSDCLWLGNGVGGFRSATADVLRPEPKGKGLGIVAFRARSDALSLFVANDTTANFFYTKSKSHTDRWTDTATNAGLAYNNAGKAEACMGIAVADCDQDSNLDLLVTNFLHESNTLYGLLADPLYTDRTREYGLHDSSLPVLSFGTQFLDANLDGNYELFIANGYTQDLSKYEIPYRMRPQMYEWTGQQFQQLVSSDLGTWSESKFVGRAVARLDWNNDGKPDLAVGVLEDSSFILTNESKTEGNAGLTIRLVALNSARDAIGTSVTVNVDGETYAHQLTAGDGFQCCNQRALFVGIESALQTGSLTIDWPSGRQQVIKAKELKQDCTIIEGRPPYSEAPNGQHGKPGSSG